MTTSPNVGRALFTLATFPFAVWACGDAETLTSTPGPDPTVTIRGARISGDPLPIPSFGDLWMPTWADDDRVYLTWGDGTGAADGFPLGYPAYTLDQSGPVTACEAGPYRPEDDGYFPCWLWCNVFGCGPTRVHRTAALTDAGILSLEGPGPDFQGVEMRAIDIPEGTPFFYSGPDGGLDPMGTNDKPSSLLAIGSRLYLAGHQPAALPVEGYVAFSDDGGRSWTQIPGSPWGADSNFRVLMFINQGRGHSAAFDGYAYALGVGTEASWEPATVYLARVPTGAITDYAAYEYLAEAGSGGPVWTADEAGARPLAGLRSTGQASAMLHEPTGRYLFLTTDAGPPDFGGALFEAPRPWGPWTQVASPCFQLSCADAGSNPAWTDGKYIAGLVPKGTSQAGVYFTISGGDRHYQLQIGLLELDVAMR